MKEIKPGDIVLVKCKVTRKIITEVDTVYNMESVHSSNYCEVHDDDIVAVSEPGSEVTFDENLNAIRGKYKLEQPCIKENKPKILVGDYINLEYIGYDVTVLLRNKPMEDEVDTISKIIIEAIKNGVDVKKKINDELDKLDLKCLAYGYFVIVCI